MRYLHVFLYHLFAILYATWVLALMFFGLGVAMIVELLSMKVMLFVATSILIQIPLVPYFYKKLIAWDARYRLGVLVPHSRYPDPPAPIVPTITDL